MGNPYENALIPVDLYNLNQCRMQVPKLETAFS